jgi:hypothetical protein
VTKDPSQDYSCGVGEAAFELETPVPSVLSVFADLRVKLDLPVPSVPSVWRGFSGVKEGSGAEVEEFEAVPAADGFA